MGINRKSVVDRYKITTLQVDRDNPMSLGNGNFACTVDVTGVQTLYGNTMAQWGWHSHPMIDGLNEDDLPLTDYESHGRLVGYASRPNGQEALFNWLRANPHRLNLGRISLRLDGVCLDAERISDISQSLDLWTGILESRFSLDGTPVHVTTCCHGSVAGVGFRIASDLVLAGRLSIAVEFPYGCYLNGKSNPSDVSAGDWEHPELHSTNLGERTYNRMVIIRQLDQDGYRVGIDSKNCLFDLERERHRVTVSPAGQCGSMECVVSFYRHDEMCDVHKFDDVEYSSRELWEGYWSTGGIIDLSNSKDKRWSELERRVIHSMYLMRVHSSGDIPPQESGLYNNSGWYGKSHVEMHWWHGVHFVLWGRGQYFSRSCSWYHTILSSSRERARKQGYKGARWPKMVGPEGRDSPSAWGPLLLWQQPHPIYYAELEYRMDPSSDTLFRWAEIIDESACFMSSFLAWNEKNGCYDIGPPVMTVPENRDPSVSRNPTFEISYWHFGLRLAQVWRERLGIAKNDEWEHRIRHLAAPSSCDGFYLMEEDLRNTYDGMNWEHPSMVGAYGVLPGDCIDPGTMRATVVKVISSWQWDRCWGWDFPMTAMAAARCGEAALAVDMLLHPSPRNRFSHAGYSLGGPYPYFPANGGLLAAVAMMAAGWDGCPERHAPGFPSDGGWDVQWEGLRRHI
jgi:hypothetical protein